MSPPTSSPAGPGSSSGREQVPAAGRQARSVVSGPLAGRRVLVTRRWPELVAAVSALGGTAIEVPTIEVRPLDDPAPLDDALRALARYAWVVFTSANAVEALATRMAALGVSMPATMRMASVGPATTQAVRDAWPAARVAVQPAGEFRGASLVDAFAGHDVKGHQVLLPVSDRAADTVERGLAALGARVDCVLAYRTVAVSPSDRLSRELGRGIDAAAFASPSAVEAFRAATGEAGLNVPAVAIGPTTAEAARAAGFNVLAVAETSTVDGLLDAFLRALAHRPHPLP